MNATRACVVSLLLSGTSARAGSDAGAPSQMSLMPKVRDDTVRDSLVRSIKAHIVEVQTCYERAIRDQPKLGGQLMVRFSVAASGKVLSAVAESSTLPDKHLEGCILERVRAWRFAKLPGRMEFSWPFAFRTGDEGPINTPEIALPPTDTNPAPKPPASGKKAR